MKAKELAKILGVSAATISLVINDKPGVSDEKRNEIISKIKELNCGYMLKNTNKHNGNIGFVVYKREGRIVDESPFFAYILEGINDSVKRHGYNLSFIHINRSMTKEDRNYQIKMSASKGLLIFAVEMLYDDLQMFKDSELPFAIIDNSFQENDVDAVAINNAQGMSKAINYLYNMGHRQIGYIESKSRINSFTERFEWYKRQLIRLGLEFNAHYIASVRYSESLAKEDMKSYLKQTKDLPTAFFAENDLLGCAAVKAMQELDYNVPEDISIIGFDNRPICTLISPMLTTINVPRDLLGPTAVELLISRLETNREQSLKIEIGTSLVERESVKKVDHL